jgi:hypothetical protein
MNESMISMMIRTQMQMNMEHILFNLLHWSYISATPASSDHRTERKWESNSAPEIGRWFFHDPLL